MFRALLELFITIVAIIVARAILTSVMRGMVNAGRTGPAPPPAANQAGTPKQAQTQASGELHKDPVCGTYVAESTPYRRLAAGQTFYYCSDACREKHTLVTR